MPAKQATKAHPGFEAVLPPNAPDKPDSGIRGQIGPGSELNRISGPSSTAEGSRSGAPPLSLGELLRTKSSEYELLAEWHAERAPIHEQHLVASQAMLVVGVVLREVAAAIDAERGEGAPH